MSKKPDKKPKPPSKPKAPPDGPSIAKGDWMKKGHSAAECADDPTLIYRPGWEAIVAIAIGCLMWAALIRLVWPA